MAEMAEVLPKLPLLPVQKIKAELKVERAGN